MPPGPAALCTAAKVRRLSRQVSQIYDDALNLHGLTIGQFGLLEIKCLAAQNHVAAILGMMDDEHFAQVQGQVWVTGRLWCDLFFYNPVMPSHTVRIERNGEYCSALSAAVPAFCDRLDAAHRQIVGEAAGVWAKDVTLHMLGKFGAEGLNYRAIEYVGSAVEAMEIDDRMTLCNHAAELGAKAALLEADEKTLAWLKAHGAKTPAPLSADADAHYADRFEIDTSQLAPQVARKHAVDDIVSAHEVIGQKINFALIGYRNSLFISKRINIC
jgi:hypothetical protein